MNEHNHPHSKQIINRMSRIIGHAEAVKRMIEEGKECSEILIQIAAVKAALNNTGKLILQDHINHCIVEAIENNDNEPLEKLNAAIDKFIK
ncbi:metal-sensing transcriptional repressor [Tissierella sp. MB52-C2]|uniref:metal-sensing transcriptional repressor n=1 Tax=Tissierella sp. MB52-C2 TaxID=3070999 RepID=UPI00280B409B|nr:metal-sensing transcriptional repressor [Tissierella sp. MB52-C2]WMM26314.1 metal-sensing transcriptional repressor [Tissierella sp. MB52-C2]